MVRLGRILKKLVMKAKPIAKLSAWLSHLLDHVPPATISLLNHLLNYPPFATISLLSHLLKHPHSALFLQQSHLLNY